MQQKKIGPWFYLDGPEALIDAHATTIGRIERQYGYIAATAPELLAVCEEILPDLKCRCDEEFTSRGRHEPNALCHHYAAVLKAIERARGPQ